MRRNTPRYIYIYILNRIPTQLVHILTDKHAHTRWHTHLPDTLQSAQRRRVCDFGVGVRVCVCVCVCIKTWIAANNIDFHFVPLRGFLFLSPSLPLSLSPSLPLCVSVSVSLTVSLI